MFIDFYRVRELVPTFAIGDHVRITAGVDAGRRAVVTGYDPDKLVAPYTLRVQGWPADLPGQDYEGDEFEEDAR